MFQVEKIVNPEKLPICKEFAKLGLAISVGPELFCNYFKDGKITKKEWTNMSKCIRYTANHVTYIGE